MPSVRWAMHCKPTNVAASCSAGVSPTRQGPQQRAQVSCGTASGCAKSASAITTAGSARLRSRKSEVLICALTATPIARPHSAVVLPAQCKPVSLNSNHPWHPTCHSTHSSSASAVMMHAKTALASGCCIQTDCRVTKPRHRNSTSNQNQARALVISKQNSIC